MSDNVKNRSIALTSLYRRFSDMCRKITLGVFIPILILSGIAHAQIEQPQQVVAELADAMQTNDGERIRSLFATDARQAYGSGSWKSGDAFWSWLESDIIKLHGRVDNSQLSVSANQVVLTGTYRNNNHYQSDANFLITVEAGKIISWHVRY